MGRTKRSYQSYSWLENVEIVRYGVMHRNTFINSPRVLDATYQLKANRNLFFAGQMTGVEGYVESAGSGLIAGINAANLALGKNQSFSHTKQHLGAWHDTLPKPTRKISNR